MQRGMHRRVINSEVRCSSKVDSLLSTKVSLGNSVSSFSFALQRRRGREFTGSLEPGGGGGGGSSCCEASRMKWSCSAVFHSLPTRRQFQAWSVAGKANGETTGRAGALAKRTRRNHSRRCKFSLSTILHASPAVGVVGSKTVRQLDLVSQPSRSGLPLVVEVRYLRQGTNLVSAPDPHVTPFLVCNECVLPQDNVKIDDSEHCSRAELLALTCI